MRPTHFTPLLATLALGVSPACGFPGKGTPKVQESNEDERVAEALARAGKFDESRDKWLELAHLSEDPRREGIYRLRVCDLYRSERRIDEARRCYLALRQNLLPADKAEAVYRAARMEMELGREKRARRALEELVIDQPNTDAAEKGARYLLELTSELGAENRIELALRLASALDPQAQLEESVRALCSLFLIDAGRTLRTLGRFDESAAALKRGWKLGEGTHWRDELLVERARTFKAQKRYEDALAVYEEFLEERESSWFVGSYDSPLLDDAAIERADLLRERGRINEAIDAYDDFVNEFPKSRLCDDASFFAATLRADRGELEALREFIERYPESRYVEQARKRILGDEN